MARMKIISDRKKRFYEKDAETIAFYRRNPCIACEELLGINLIDSQKYILQQSWNKPHVLWCCSRNFGKSFLGAIFMILKALLYENQAIYIVSSVGSQSKETFTKIEEIVTRCGKTMASMDFTMEDGYQMPNYVGNETIKSANNKTGFSHSQEGFHVTFYNGSEIFTLNGSPDNNRSKRATCVFFDESAFCSDELITVCEAFATQNTEFKTSTRTTFNPDTLKRKVPTQLVYASSQDSMDKIFYKHYKEFAKKMLAGDRDYFCCDMICDTAIHTYMNGKEYVPLLTQEKVDTAMKGNRQKSLREYYNEPTLDGGVNQIVKWGMVRRNEDFQLPEMFNIDNSQYVIAFDPARTKDNSVMTIMKICKDDNIGYYGKIINCINLVDEASKKKYKLDSTRQIEQIRECLLNYNGKNPDYMNVHLLIDAGAGGGGVSAYGDNLLKEWTDTKGTTHKGLLDINYDVYEGYEYDYPDNSHNIALINPRKYKREMTEKMIDLVTSDLIKLPREYSGNGYIKVSSIDNETKEEIFTDRELAWEEELALRNIDELKTEITSIFRFSNQDNTSVTYALPTDKENKLHDDRFYTFIMLANYLFDLRRSNLVEDDHSAYEVQCYAN